MQIKQKDFQPMIRYYVHEVEENGRNGNSIGPLVGKQNPPKEEGDILYYYIIIENNKNEQIFGKEFDILNNDNCEIKIDGFEESFSKTINLERG